MHTKNWDDFLKERFTEEEIKEIKRRALKNVKKYEFKAKERKPVKKYNISFYTLEDMQNNAEPTYYIEDATSHDIDIIDTLIDNDKEHNFAHFDGAIIDLNQFTVIRYEEVEEDEE